MIKQKKTNDSESEDYVEVIDMKAAAWKKYIHGLIDIVELELRPLALTKSRAALNEFRIRVNRDHVKRRRKRFQNELDELIETDPVLHAAASRHVKKVLRETTKTLRAATKDIKALTKASKKKKRARERTPS